MYCEHGMPKEQRCSLCETKLISGHLRDSPVGHEGALAVTPRRRGPGRKQIKRPGRTSKAGSDETPFAVLIEMIRLADAGRCMACGWPLESSAARGCVLGNCSFRPQQDEEPYRRWMERTRILTLARKDAMEETRGEHRP